MIVNLCLIIGSRDKCEKKIGISPNRITFHDMIYSMSKQYTSAQVAEMLGYSRSMVLLVCQRKNLPRVGKQYVLGDDEISIIKNSLGHKPTGRPKKGDR